MKKNSSRRKRTLLTIGVILVGCLSGIAVYLKVVLPQVSAAPDLKIEYTPERIARGEYLATHVAVCMDCHSTRDWAKFSAPMVSGTLGKGGEYFGPEMGFPGKYYSKNLTPSHLGNWTDGEIFRAISVGVDKEGKAIFPLMPYPFYRTMAEEDIYDIIAYIRQLPAIANDIPPSQSNFPMNFIINTIPVEAAFTKRPAPGDQINYGKYLVNMAACQDCHTQFDKGQSNAKMAYAGGREFELPTGTLISANITPDAETGIGKWSEEFFLDRFKLYRDPAKLPVLDPESVNTIMPWTMYAGMEDRDLKAMYAYLMSLSPIENKVEHFVGKGQ